MSFSTRYCGQSFQKEKESTVAFLSSYYSVQPDKSSFAFSLNHTICDLSERTLTRSLTTGMVDFSCAGFADHIPSTFRSCLKKSTAKYC